MKLKRFGELDEVNVGDFPEEKQNVPQDNQDALRSFNDACEHFDFFGAFEIAQNEGLFGGDFEEYMESREKAGGGDNGGYQKMLKLYHEYIKIASQLKDLIISDIEQAQNEPK